MLLIYTNKGCFLKYFKIRGYFFVPYFRNICTAHLFQLFRWGWWYLEIFFCVNWIVKISGNLLFTLSVNESLFPLAWLLLTNFIVNVIWLSHLIHLTRPNRIWRVLSTHCYVRIFIKSSNISLIPLFLKKFGLIV